MKTFNLCGEVRLGSEIRRFSKNIQANDKEHAIDLLMAHFGSKHKLPRRFINLVEVSEITQSTVLQELRSGKQESGKE